MAANPGLNVDWCPTTLPAGTGVHLQTSVTVDGNAAKGTLYTPAGREPRDTTVLVLMHPDLRAMDQNLDKSDRA
jgi:hypothetical protein